ncbi:PREDICTED: oxysterol-binding protein-related protein 8-like, partial [Priapulus caudatus]|uniref:Oxysterol-binding protein-related protein 8-like n=1 Tax=Priapulus caudatus TaxID=37621 RepID=A0ABM1F7R3_PRICU
MQEWVPRLFERDIISGDWVYMHADLRPWDSHNDVVQYEHNFVVQTKTMHHTAIVRTTSILSVEEAPDGGKRILASG